MGKRSSFERRERDFYHTPREAVLPLLPHLNAGTRFCEPCAGDGALVDHLTAAGHICECAFDVEPQRPDIYRMDARANHSDGAPDCYITNPPWDRTILHEIIPNLARDLPTWLLFDADWLHTRQSVPFLPMLRKVVSVGRVKWIPDSKMTGKDNCAWYLFDARHEGETVFVGRTERMAA